MSTAVTPRRSRRPVACPPALWGYVVAREDDPSRQPIFLVTDTDPSAALRRAQRYADSFNTGQSETSRVVVCHASIAIGEPVTTRNRIAG